MAWVRYAGLSSSDLHQPRALVRARIVEEIAGLGGRRDLADQVEVDAAQELGVIGGPGGLHLGLGPLGGQQAVDLLRRAPSRRSPPRSRAGRPRLAPVALSSSSSAPAARADSPPSTRHTVPILNR